MFQVKSFKIKVSTKRLHEMLWSIRHATGREDYVWKWITTNLRIIEWLGYCLTISSLLWKLCPSCLHSFWEITLFARLLQIHLNPTVFTVADQSDSNHVAWWAYLIQAEQEHQFFEEWCRTVWHSPCTLLMLLPWHLRSAPPGPQPRPLMILGTAHVFLDGLHMMPRRWRWFGHMVMVEALLLSNTPALTRRSSGSVRCSGLKAQTCQWGQRPAETIIKHQPHNMDVPTLSSQCFCQCSNHF